MLYGVLCRCCSVGTMTAQVKDCVPILLLAGQHSWSTSWVSDTTRTRTRTLPSSLSPHAGVFHLPRNECKKQRGVSELIYSDVSSSPSSSPSPSPLEHSSPPASVSTFSLASPAASPSASASEAGSSSSQPLASFDSFSAFSISAARTSLRRTL